MWSILWKFDIFISKWSMSLFWLYLIQNHLLTFCFWDHIIFSIIVLNIFKVWQIKILFVPSWHGSSGSASIIYCTAHLILGLSPTNDTCTSSWIQRLGHHADYQQVSKYIRGKFQEYIACRQWSMQVRDPSWFWNPGQMSPEVQKKDISDPKKGLISPKNYNKTNFLHIYLLLATSFLFIDLSSFLQFQIYHTVNSIFPGTNW